MRHLEFPIISFLLVPLVLAPLPSHIRAGNVSILSLIAWLAVMNIIRGVNTIAWAGNVDVKFVVWCDITTKILIGFTYAVPSSAMCILRHLEAVSSTRHVSFSAKQKRNRQIFETTMCFGVPMIFMTLHYVVQGHRFDLVEDFGCAPAVYISIPAILILWFPPLLISSISAIYAALSLRNFLRNRIAFVTHLQNSQSAISQSRYFRLMALAIVEISWDTSINIYLVYLNVQTGLFPWTTWDDVHSNFSRIARYPNFLVPQELINENIFEWWIVPISSLFFILFFGFSEEAISDYKVALGRITGTFFSRNRKHTAPTPLPVHSLKLHSSEVSPELWDSISFRTSPFNDGSIVPPYQSRFASDLSIDELEKQIVSEPSSIHHTCPTDDKAMLESVGCEDMSSPCPSLKDDLSEAPSDFPLASHLSSQLVSNSTSMETQLCSTQSCITIMKNGIAQPMDCRRNSDTEFHLNSQVH